MKLRMLCNAEGGGQGAGNAGADGSATTTTTTTETAAAAATQAKEPTMAELIAVVAGLGKTVEGVVAQNAAQHKEFVDWRRETRNKGGTSGGGTGETKTATTTTAATTTAAEAAPTAADAMAMVTRIQKDLAFSEALGTAGLGTLTPRQKKVLRGEFDQAGDVGDGAAAWAKQAAEELGFAKPGGQANAAAAQTTAQQTTVTPAPEAKGKSNTGGPGGSNQAPGQAHSHKDVDPQWFASLPPHEQKKLAEQWVAKGSNQNPYAGPNSLRGMPGRK